MNDARPSVRPTVAERINYLFEKLRPPGQGRPYTNAEVARGTGLSATHIGYLRKGLRDNPTAESLRSIAGFFGVDAAYLIDDSLERTQHIAAQIRLASVLRNERVQGLALRLVDANPSAEALDAIAEVIEQVLRLDDARGRAPSRRTSQPEA